AHLHLAVVHQAVAQPGGRLPRERALVAPLVVAELEGHGQAAGVAPDDQVELGGGEPAAVRLAGHLPRGMNLAHGPPCYHSFRFTARPPTLRRRLMAGSTRRLITVFLLTCALLAAGPRREAAAQAKPEGEMRFAVYVSLVPSWNDPGEV